MPSNSEGIQLVFVEPDPTPWHRVLLTGPKGFYLKWLSEGVVGLDGSRYSHVVIRNGPDAIDARLSGVGVFEFARLQCTGRTLAPVARAGGLQAVWDVLFDFVTPDEDIPLRRETPAFTVLGMLRIGILLLLDGPRWGQRAGRWMVKQRADDPGFFCSELIAKGMIEASMELEVTVPAHRIEALLANPEVAISLHGRGGSQVTGEQWLDSLRDLVLADETRLPVGYGGRQYPPALVTPADLFGSPSLQVVEPLPPPLGEPERRRRFRAWLTWTALAVVAALLLARGGWRALRCALGGRSGGSA